MADRPVALGVDYGTNSVRALLVDAHTGEELGTGTADYASGEAGIFTDSTDPNCARQHPGDYFDGFFESVQKAMEDAQVDPQVVVGIGVDTTGSTPIPVNAQAVPLACTDGFKGNLNAMAWLWKDHTSYAEAQEITDLAAKQGKPYLSKCGGTYSSEWFWSKILHCKRIAPEVFEAAETWVECQDMIPAWLCGVERAEDIPRGTCAAGHKAIFHSDWGGLPSLKFLDELDPGLGDLRSRLFSSTKVIGELAGNLSPKIAAQAGLPAGLPVSIGAMDAHLGALGSGVKPGTLVKIMGTSTCDIMVGDEKTPDIPGVCGVVPGSVLPGMMGIEAGQSAVGDLFSWCVAKLGHLSHAELTERATRLRPGESGLLALDWNNGNRTVLVDPRLTGLLIGQTLSTDQAEIYRALIEATAFGARKIIERIEEFGVPIREIVVCGGIADRSTLSTQIYSDVFNRPVKISRSAQTCALGAAMCGAVVGGVQPDFASAVASMTGTRDEQYRPQPDAVKVYDRLYQLYSSLHDTFGKRGLSPDLSGLMKELLTIRDEARRR